MSLQYEFEAHPTKFRQLRVQATGKNNIAKGISKERTLCVTV